MLDGLEVVQEYPGIHGVFDGLILNDHVKVSGPAQDSWQAWDAVGRHAWDVQLLTQGHEATSHGDQIMYRWAHVLHPLARVTWGDKQDILQLLGLLA